MSGQPGYYQALPIFGIPLIGVVAWFVRFDWHADHDASADPEGDVFRIDRTDQSVVTRKPMVSNPLPTGPAKTGTE